MFSTRRTLTVSGVFLWSLLVQVAVAGQVQPTRLRCEYAENPLGIDVQRPRLSWVLRSAERGQKQTAYQVLAASEPGLLKEETADLWDSGRVDSSASLHVEYAGLPLRSGQRVYWSVRTWDRENRPSVFSTPAWWEMALLGTSDWHGIWIRHPGAAGTQPEDFFADDPAPLLRREFTVKKPLRRARAYMSGLGYGELYLNGRRVGDRLLDPAWTTYSKRVFYSAYDVTDLLRPGENAVGIMLGNGWYNPLPMKMWGRYNLRESLTIGRPRAILQMNLEYTDGSREEVVTDERWKSAAGPVIRNSVYLGEVYDARREQPGWCAAGFDDRGWTPVEPADEPIGALRAQDLPPIRATRVIPTAAIHEPQPGVLIYDLGQNFAGWVRLRVRGEAGTRVTMRYGELLNTDGTLNVMTSVAGQIKQPGLGGPGAPDVACQREEYVLKGGDVETYVPRFTFHGFRYVEVTAEPARPEILSLEGLRLNTDVAPAGTFVCSSELYNRIQRAVEWTLLSNLFGVQSDCPHREKFGYGGDIAATSEMAMLNFDMARFYAKTVRDFGDAARPNGGITETAPFVGIDADQDGLGGGAGPVGWGTGFPLLQWQLYQYYGDRRILEEQYDTTRRWIDFLESRAENDLLDNGISDHESLVPKPRALTGTAFYHQNVSLAARIAGVLGHRDDATRYAALAKRIRTAFNTRFLHANSGQYDSATQTAQAFALFMGLVPEEDRERALRVLIDDVAEHGSHLTTGIFGTKYLLRVLSEMGQADVAARIVGQEDFPGWGHMLRGGATTLWETWAFSDNVYSHNHPMFGSVSEWFYRTAAGINPADDAVGFDRIVIRPAVVGGLTWASTCYESVRGNIRSAWRLENGWFRLDVTIPVGATATVHVPASPGAEVLEGLVPAERADQVRLLHRGSDEAVFQVPAGDYTFTCGRTADAPGPIR